MNAKDRKRVKLQQLRAIPKPSASFSGVAVQVEDFVNARKAEIEALESALANSISPIGKRIFQTLPKRLRRRAASHNTKRLPAGLQLYAKIQDEKQNFQAKMKQRHKFKRRAINQNIRYLHSHLWHAKRMKMDNYWGFRLSDRPTEKSRLRIHRAFKYSCVIHDASYHEVFVLSIAHPDKIVSVFSGVTDPNLPPICHSRFVAQGMPGLQYFYKENEYPRCLISPFSFLWIKNAGSAADERKLIIITHPLGYEDMMLFLKSKEKEFNSIRFPSRNFVPDFGLFHLRGPESDNILSKVFPSSGCLAENQFSLKVPLEEWKNLVTGPLKTERKFEATRVETGQSKIFETCNNDEFSVLFVREELLFTNQTCSSFQGWNILVPAKFARLVWNALARQKVRVTGLRSIRTEHLEAGVPQFPYDFHETKAYRDLQEQKSVKILMERKKFPPSKCKIKRGPFDMPITEKSITDFIPDADQRWAIRTPKMQKIFMNSLKVGCLHDFSQCFLPVHVQIIGKGIPLTGSAMFVLPIGTTIPKDGHLNGKHVGDLEPFGYVTNGDLSLVLSKGKGVGTAKAETVAKLIAEKAQNRIIIQNIRTQEYYLASISIIIL